MIAIMETKRGPRQFDININISPKPRNCYECPLYYMPEPEDKDGCYEYWKCFIYNNDNYGVAIDRPQGCPLDAQ